MEAVELAERIMQAARSAETEAGVAATLLYRGKPFSGGKIADARVRATVVAALREMASEFRAIGDRKHELGDQDRGEWRAYQYGCAQEAADAEGRLLNLADTIELS